MRDKAFLSAIPLLYLAVGSGLGWPIPAAVSFSAYPARFVLIEAALAVPLLIAFRRAYRTFAAKRRKSSGADETSAFHARKLLSISGMACGHCAMKVESELMDVPGVSEVKVDVQEGNAMVVGDGMKDAELSAAVAKAGYRVTGILGSR